MNPINISDKNKGSLAPFNQNVNSYHHTMSTVSLAQSWQKECGLLVETYFH